MNDTVLIVAAHPDDEILGVGGTIARHVSRGDVVEILIVAEGATSRSDAEDGDLAKLREAANKAAQALGASPPILLGFPDNKLDSVPLLDLIHAVEAHAKALSPSIVYTHHRGDLNVDHRQVHEAVLTAFRPLPGETVRAIYAFETISSTEWGVGPAFRPNHFVDIESVLEQKLEALSHYAMEMRDAPHARSMDAVKALAQMRGATVGLAAVEAFEVVRQITSMET